MPNARSLAHEFAIATRLAARSLRRRLAGGEPAPATYGEFRAALEPWLGSLPPGLVSRHAFVTVHAKDSWLDTGIELEPGDTVTLLAQGRVYFSRALDIWVGPSLRLWGRVGDGNPVFRGTHETNTFTVHERGRLLFASRFPGEWLDPCGEASAHSPEYARASGDLSVLVLRWSRGTDAHDTLRGCARAARVPGLVLAEAKRLERPVPIPEHWQHDWRIGPSEVFSPARTPDGRPAVGCLTHHDVGILRRDARLPLLPGTRLQWSWRVTELPSALPEDTLLSHDYLSIAVEFDDGQDLTYFWSSALPVGSAFRCPLPVWRDIETHVVVRSGPGGLGDWLAEERDVGADYRRLVGGAAREVAAVWLIGESVLQRGYGRCEYASIRLTNNERTLEVL